MPHRVLISDLTPAVELGEMLAISGDEAHHALRAKRVGSGDAVTVLNGAGLVVRGIVQSTSLREGRMDVEITSLDTIERARPLITIASAVPKGRRTDAMIDAMSQAGADRWIPMICARSVVEPRESDTKSTRWARIAIESAKQCGRAWLMEFAPTQALADVIRRADSAGAQVIVSDGDGANPSEVFSTRALGPKSDEVVICIGPEGGFTEDERELMRGHGARVMTLGPNVMRIETAATCAAALARVLLT